MLETANDVTNNEFYTSIYNSRDVVISKENFAEEYKDLYFNADTLCFFPGGQEGWLRFRRPS